MHGNVFEWCQDARVGYRAQPAVDPQFPFPGQRWDRIVRGGAIGIIPKSCRSADRFWADPGKTSTGYGFRVVAEVVPQAEKE
jgi:formylglycine-generating enzyme required for sulfatase activity